MALLELVNPNSAGSITGKTLLIENQDKTGDDQYLLRVVEKNNGKYYLKANNPDYKTMLATDHFRTFARLREVIKE
jgi:SOS-response transcriptional repressor LexA